MKLLHFTFALVPLAGLLVAGESNLYFNPEFQSKTDKKGNFVILDHWYEGKASISGKYEDSPVLRLEQVNVSWGGFNCAALLWHNIKRDLKPGKYTFSVWCKLKDKPSYVYLHYGCLPAGQEERIRKTKFYRGSSVTKGTWMQLSMNFEVKPGDTKQDFAYDVQSSDALGPRIVWFSNPQIIPAQ